MIDRQPKRPGRKVVGGDRGESTQFPLRLYGRQMLAVEMLCASHPGWSKADAVRHLIDTGINYEPSLGELR